MRRTAPCNKELSSPKCQYCQFGQTRHIWSSKSWLIDNKTIFITSPFQGQSILSGIKPWVRDLWGILQPLRCPRSETVHKASPDLAPMALASIWKLQIGTGQTRAAWVSSWHDSWPPLEWMIQERKQGRSCPTLYDLFIHHYFHHILFLKGSH